MMWGTKIVSQAFELFKLSNGENLDQQNNMMVEYGDEEECEPHDSFVNNDAHIDM